MSAREVLFELNICLDSELCVIDKGREKSLGSHFVVQPLHSEGDPKRGYSFCTQWGVCVHVGACMCVCVCKWWGVCVCM